MCVHVCVHACMHVCVCVHSLLCTQCVCVCNVGLACFASCDLTACSHCSHFALEESQCGCSLYLNFVQHIMLYFHV